MKVEELALSDIKPYKNNPRKNDEAAKYVAESIKQFGFKVPIVIDKDNVIVCGHTRFKAAKKLKLKTVPCIMADDLTDEQIKAYRLADNKVSEKAEWDLDLLNLELDELSFTDIDMSDFGFDLDLEGEEEPKEVEEDDFEEELPEEPKAKLGDIYQLGNHRLMCGDSTNKDDVSMLMNGEKADMVFTDPPYGYKYESNYQSTHKMLKNDDKILDFITAIYAVLKDNCPIYSFCGWQSLNKWLTYFEKTELNLKNIIIWKKNNWSMGDLKGAYAGQYEVILYLNKGRVELKGGRNTDVWEFDREPPKLHPTMKPIELIGFALEKSSHKKDIVLDVFGGSGSTLMACEQLKRKCYMMELDPKYVDVIINRWEQFTGEKAIKINE